MEEEEPNLGKLIDQKPQQIFWDRTADKKVKSLTMIFEEHVLMIQAYRNFLIINLEYLNK